MALLDVSEVITDPLFASPVTFIRRSEGADEYGNPQWVEDERIESRAVVTADAKALSRLPDEMRQEGTILVRALIKDVPEGFGTGYDCVLWRGRTFVVKDCGDYSQFGNGFLRLVCQPEDSYGRHE